MMHPQCYVAHRTSNRVRVKFPGRRHDQEFFSNLQRQLLGRKGILAVVVNPLTASLLIEHQMDGLSIRSDLSPDRWQAAHVGAPDWDAAENKIASVLAELLVAFF